MKRAEAEGIAGEASQALLGALADLGCLVEVGQPDGEGNIITRERLDELLGILNKAGLEALREKIEITEE